MNQFLAAIKSGLANFARDEEGAQIVEYTLIKAVVSIALIIALSAIGGRNRITFIACITNCLTTVVVA